jgi:hypothetical protein
MPVEQAQQFRAAVTPKSGDADACWHLFNYSLN